MIEQAIRSDYYPIPPIVTFGCSNIAQYIEKEAKNIRDRMQESNYLGLRAKGVSDELLMVADECGNPGWDGNNAVPITENIVQKAEQFLTTLPLGIEAPSVGAEPDGCVTFECYRSPIHVFSVSISSDGFLHYAYLREQKNIWKRAIFKQRFHGHFLSHNECKRMNS